MFLQVEGFSSDRRLKEQNKALVLHVSSQFGAPDRYALRLSTCVLTGHIHRTVTTQVRTRWVAYQQ